MKAHRTDGVSLSFGLIFLAVVGWWLAAQMVTVRLPALGWFAAVGLILFGGIGLLGALRSGKAGADPGSATAGTDAGAVGSAGGDPADTAGDPADYIRDPAAPAVEPVSGGRTDTDLTRDLLDGPDRAGVEPVTGPPGSPARPPHGPA